MNLLKKTVLFCAIIFAAATTGCGKDSGTAYKTSYIMSTVVTQQLTGDKAEATAKKIESALMDFEAKTSMYKDSSYIFAINESAGKSDVEIDRSTYELLKRSVEYSEKSEGLFDITIGSLTCLWNINGENPSVPVEEDIKNARALVDYNAVVLDERDGKYYAAINEKDGIVDLGGIAKGYSLDICREILEQSDVDYGFLSVGGNVLVYGDKNTEGFNVGIREPKKDSENYFCALNLSNTIVSTTGGYERFFIEDGITYHHVLDARTGYPANTDLISVSVVFENGATADFLSTWLYIEGLDEAIKTANENGYSVVLVDENKNVYVSEALRDSLVLPLCDTEHYTFKYI